MDEAGTPFCITIDGETAAAQTVTVRARDAMTQERIGIAQLAEFIGSRVRG
jgi:glycyl-tRNA synthetase